MSRELQASLAYSLAKHELDEWRAADDLDLSGNEFDGFGDIDRFYNPGEPRTAYAGVRASFC